MFLAYKSYSYWLMIASMTLSVAFWIFKVFSTRHVINLTKNVYEHKQKRWSAKSNPFLVDGFVKSCRKTMLVSLFDFFIMIKYWSWISSIRRAYTSELITRPTAATSASTATTIAQSAKIKKALAHLWVSFEQSTI